MSSAHNFPLEFAEIDGVVKQDFWRLISGLAEYQKQHADLYGQIENELEWVDVNKFKSQENYSTAEERWLHRVIRDLELSANGSRAKKTYVVPFRGSLPGEVVYYDGIPGDVYFIVVYGAEPYPMKSLRDEHLLAQYFYSLQLSEGPSARREKLRLKLQRLIASTSDPHWTAIYNSLFP
ncbi:hypothetical protein SUGI_0992580 [Cryptomeria japonica]|uniref:uncharacterized protein LOC131033319 n=1 Tax=Cryptomeria japonica TaxID=3369 RepID=UPI0024148B0D|nr:uncharacterized protein LOC131033319 [Cryptomeria japonica]GLJ47012.1 hypothetical protein SUGI_0992580 [Cryptomeria japonica]